MNVCGKFFVKGKRSADIKTAIVSSFPKLLLFYFSYSILLSFVIINDRYVCHLLITICKHAVALGINRNDGREILYIKTINCFCAEVFIGEGLDFFDTV